MTDNRAHLSRCSWEVHSIPTVDSVSTEFSQSCIAHANPTTTPLASISTLSKQTSYHVFISFSASRLIPSLRTLGTPNALRREGRGPLWIYITSHPLILPIPGGLLQPNTRFPRSPLTIPIYPTSQHPTMEYAGGQSTNAGSQPPVFLQLPPSIPYFLYHPSTPPHAIDWRGGALGWLGSKLVYIGGREHRPMVDLCG